MRNLSCSLYGAKYPLRLRSLTSGRFTLISTFRQVPSCAGLVETIAELILRLDFGEHLLVGRVEVFQRA